MMGIKCASLVEAGLGGVVVAALEEKLSEKVVRVSVKRVELQRLLEHRLSLRLPAGIQQLPSVHVMQQGIGRQLADSPLQDGQGFLLPVRGGEKICQGQVSRTIGAIQTQDLFEAAFCSRMISLLLIEQTKLHPQPLAAGLPRNRLRNDLDGALRVAAVS